ncbi:hypothetical protein [Pantoea sp. GM01]|uniref:hypothetical protein n=1 Tax=Pantoea sp. GM01 TaxID=1144320 RepID=UPI0002711DD4|nr:hypothetical protein [Pantoea sp. GM01]EJL89939.1 hypothetical protein PMI17_01895 [Pantoea sp. GM01]
MKKVLVLMSGLLFAQASVADGGTINFIGAITEPACTTRTYSHQTVMQCSQNGREKAREIKLNAQPQTLPFQLGDVSVKSSGNIKSIQVVYR